MTTDELIKLAKFCGHELIINGDGCVFIQIGGVNERWQPHIDANQRDEVVEALIKKDCPVWVYSYKQKQTGEMRHNASVQIGEDIYSTQGSNRLEVGEAVCAAAMQAIEYMKGKSDD